MTSSDGLGQQYISPEEAVGVRHTDVIIVGRGITQVRTSGGKVRVQCSLDLFVMKVFLVQINLVKCYVFINLAVHFYSHLS